jgi:hypothetical protein
MELLRRLLWLLVLCAVAVFLGGGFLMGLASVLGQLADRYNGRTATELVGCIWVAGFFGSLVVLAVPVVSRMVAALMTWVAGFSIILWVCEELKDGAGMDELSDGWWAIAAIIGAWTFRLTLRRAIRLKWAW